MLTALTLGNSLWSLAVSQYIRFHAYEIHLSPTLHQVEMLRPRDQNATFTEGAAANPYLAPTAILSRTQISYPEWRVLRYSRVPTRQSAGIRGEVLVRPGGAAVQPIVGVARFTDATFFSMFERPFSAGGPFTAADEAAGARVAVLGRATAARLFPGGGAVGQTVSIKGAPSTSWACWRGTSR